MGSEPRNAPGRLFGGTQIIWSVGLEREKGKTTRGVATCRVGKLERNRGKADQGGAGKKSQI